MVPCSSLSPVAAGRFGAEDGAASLNCGVGVIADESIGSRHSRGLTRRPTGEVPRLQKNSNRSAGLGEEAARQQPDFRGGRAAFVFISCKRRGLRFRVVR